MSNTNGILQEERDFGPAHFTLKIESYSLLSNAYNGLGKRYESSVFDVGGYKWKLILYPYGDKSCEGKGNISLYVAIDESNSFPKDNWIVVVYLKLFVLNQKTKKYLTIQDAKGGVKYFDKLRTEQGCTQLVSLDEFNDPFNGYLVNDCCVFGAEIVVVQPSSGSEETLSMVKEPTGRTHTWSIKNFSKLNDNFQYSDEFTVGGRKWKLHLYPKGNIDSKKSLSLYLLLSDWNSVKPGIKVYAEYKLRVVNHSHLKKVEKQVSHWFNSSKKDWGYLDFISLRDIHEVGNGYLKDDTLIVEVEFIVISETKVQP